MGHDASRRAVAAQARNAIADELDRITRRVDTLTHRARLGINSAAEYDELEEMAQAIARDIVAPFRGRRPTHAPLHISADGRKAAW